MNDVKKLLLSTCNIVASILLLLFFVMRADAKEPETEKNTEIVIVLDCSQSMKNVDSQYKVLDFIKEIFAIVPINYEIGVVAYNDEVCFSLPLGSNYEEVEEKLKDVEYKHYGNAGAGLLEAVSLFEREPADRRILMISDGEIMMKTEEQTEKSVEEYMQAVENALQESIVIDVMALGQLIDEGYTVYSAAEDTDGQIYELADSEGLSDFVEEQLFNEWKIKKSHVGTLTGTSGELSVKLPDCYMDKTKIFLLGEQQNENFTVNCKADAINIYKGENYTVVEIWKPESKEVKVQMSSEQSMEVRAYLTAEYNFFLTTGYTYMPVTDTAAGIAEIWLEIENQNGENLLNGHLDDSRLKVYFNEKEQDYTISNGKICFKEAIEKDKSVTLKIEPDELYGNYYGTMEVSQQIIVPEPEEKPEPIDWFFWIVIGIFVIVMLLLLFLYKQRNRKISTRGKMIDESRILPKESRGHGNDFYGKIQIYVIHNKNDIDYPPECINLFARCNRDMITLEWLLDACNLPLNLRGAEKIVIRPGADKSLIIKNNSKAAALMGRELLMKGNSYHLYYHEKVTFIFDQEDTEIEVHYKDLKPNER